MSFQRLLNTPVYSGNRADLPTRMTEGSTYIATDTKEVFVTGGGESPFVVNDGLNYHCYNMIQDASGITFEAATISTGLNQETNIQNSQRIGVGVNRFDVRTTGDDVIDLSIGSRLNYDGETKPTYILKLVGVAEILGQKISTYEITTYTDGILNDFVFDETPISFRSVQ